MDNTQSERISKLESSLDAALDREMALEDKCHQLKLEVKLVDSLWLKLDRQIQQSKNIEFLQTLLIRVLERR